MGPEAETPDTGALVQSLLRSRFCMPQQRVHIAKQRPQAANNVFFFKRYGDSQVTAVKKLDMEENLKCVLFGVEKNLMTYKISLLKNKGKWHS